MFLSRGDLITASYLMEEVSFWGSTLLVRWSVPPLLRFCFYRLFVVLFVVGFIITYTFYLSTHFSNIFGLFSLFLFYLYYF